MGDKYSVVLGWLCCCLGFSLLRSAIEVHILPLEFIILLCKTHIKEYDTQIIIHTVKVCPYPNSKINCNWVETRDHVELVSRSFHPYYLIKLADNIYELVASLGIILPCLILYRFSSLLSSVSSARSFLCFCCSREVRLGVMKVLLM